MATLTPEACAASAGADRAPRAPRAGSDAFCPECGQSLRLRALPGPSAAPGRPRAAWLFLVVGAYLLLAFGGPAPDAYRLVGDREAGLYRPHDTLGALASAREATAALRSPGSPSAAEVYANGRAQLDHDLPRVGMGAALLLLGLGALARRRMRRRGEAAHAGLGPVVGALSRLPRSRALGGAWELAEGGLTALLLLALATYLYFLGAQLWAGAPPTAELALRVANRTIDAWFFAAADLGMFLRTPNLPAGRFPS
jgi:hypothetical protein